MAYTNSNLVTYKNISKNKNSPRNHEIDTITIHCIVGQWTAKQGCDYFATTGREVSANYVVGCDGSIGLSVDEKDRSWCTSSRSNDNRAVTIEVASDTTHPYAVTDKALNALIELVADICKRNNIKELKWEGKRSLIGQVDKQNMTVHRWFSDTECPGDYLYNKHPYIVKQVNRKLGIVDPDMLDVDGSFGRLTVLASQKYFGTVQDGVISGQSAIDKKYLEAAVSGAWEFKTSNATGSSLVKAMQKKFGATADGYFGKNSVKAMQKWLNSKGYNCGTVDGYMGAKTVRAWQMFLNDQM